MRRFSKKLSEIAGESKFSKLELEKLFTTEEEQNTLVKVSEALKKAQDENETIYEITSLGNEGLKVLLKITRSVLLP